MMGMASERLLPFTPWQAAQVMTLASGESNGPGAEAGPWARAGARSRIRRVPRRRGDGWSTWGLLAYPITSVQMLCVQLSARAATDAFWAGVSRCSICTTLPPSILYALTTAIASVLLTQL